MAVRDSITGVVMGSAGATAAHVPVAVMAPAEEWIHQRHGHSSHQQGALFHLSTCTVCSGGVRGRRCCCTRSIHALTTRAVGDGYCCGRVISGAD